MENLEDPARFPEGEAGPLLRELRSLVGEGSEDEWTPSHFAAEFEPRITELDAMVNGHPGPGRLRRILGDLRYHLGAACGVGDLNGHSRHTHYVWSLSEIGKLEMPMRWVDEAQAGP